MAAQPGDGLNVRSVNILYSKKGIKEALSADQLCAAQMFCGHRLFA